MFVNTPRKVKFSNPHRSYWESGPISLMNDVVSKLSSGVNKHKSQLDFTAQIFPDKSYRILTKRNIDGLRR